jgi:hypothetical protein
MITALYWYIYNFFTRQNHVLVEQTEVKLETNCIITAVADSLHYSKEYVFQAIRNAGYSEPNHAELEEEFAQKFIDPAFVLPLIPLVFGRLCKLSLEEEPGVITFIADNVDVSLPPICLHASYGKIKLRGHLQTEKLLPKSEFDLTCIFNRGHPLDPEISRRLSQWRLGGNTILIRSNVNEIIDEATLQPDKGISIIQGKDSYFDVSVMIVSLLTRLTDHELVRQAENELHKKIFSVENSVTETTNFLLIAIYVLDRVQTLTENSPLKTVFLCGEGGIHPNKRKNGLKGVQNLALSASSSSSSSSAAASTATASSTIIRSFSDELRKVYRLIEFLLQKYPAKWSKVKFTNGLGEAEVTAAYLAFNKSALFASADSDMHLLALLKGLKHVILLPPGSQDYLVHGQYSVISIDLIRKGLAKILNIKTGIQLSPTHAVIMILLERSDYMAGVSKAVRRDIYTAIATTVEDKPASKSDCDSPCTFQGISSEIEKILLEVFKVKTNLYKTTLDDMIFYLSSFSSQQIVSDSMVSSFLKDTDPSLFQQHVETGYSIRFDKVNVFPIATDDIALNVLNGLFSPTTWKAYTDSNDFQNLAMSAYNSIITNQLSLINHSWGTDFKVKNEDIAAFRDGLLAFVKEASNKLGVSDGDSDAKLLLQDLVQRTKKSTSNQSTGEDSNIPPAYDNALRILAQCSVKAWPFQTRNIDTIINGPLDEVKNFLHNLVRPHSPPSSMSWAWPGSKFGCSFVSSFPPVYNKSTEDGMVKTYDEIPSSFGTFVHFFKQLFGATSINAEMVNLGTVSGKVLPSGALSQATSSEDFKNDCLNLSIPSILTPFFNGIAYPPPVVFIASLERTTIDILNRLPNNNIVNINHSSVYAMDITKLWINTAICISKESYKGKKENIVRLVMYKDRENKVKLQFLISMDEPSAAATESRASGVFVNFKSNIIKQCGRLWQSLLPLESLIFENEEQVVSMSSSNRADLILNKYSNSSLFTLGVDAHKASCTIGGKRSIRSSGEQFFRLLKMAEERKAAAAAAVVLSTQSDTSLNPTSSSDMNIAADDNQILEEEPTLLEMSMDTVQRSRLLIIAGTYFKFAVRRLLKDNVLKVDPSTESEADDEYDSFRVKDLVVNDPDKFPVTLSDLFIISRGLQHEHPADEGAHSIFQEWLGIKSEDFQLKLLKLSPNILPFRSFEEFFVNVITRWYTNLNNDTDFLRIAVNLIGIAHNELWIKRLDVLLAMSGARSNTEKVRLMSSNSFASALKMSVDDYKIYVDRMPGLLEMSGARSNTEKVRLMSSDSFASALKMNKKEYEIYVDRMPGLLEMSGARSNTEKVRLMSSDCFASALKMNKKEYDIYVDRMPGLLEMSGARSNTEKVTLMSSDSFASALKMNKKEYEIYVDRMPGLLEMSGARSNTEKVTLMSSNSFASALKLKVDEYQSFLKHTRDFFRGFKVNDTTNKLDIMADPNLVPFLKKKDEDFDNWFLNLLILRFTFPFIERKNLHDIFSLFMDTNRSTNLVRNLSKYLDALSTSFTALDESDPITDDEKQLFFNASRGKLSKVLADLTSEQMDKILAFIGVFIPRVFTVTENKKDKTTFTTKSRPTRNTILMFFKRNENLLIQLGDVPDENSILEFLKEKRPRSNDDRDDATAKEEEAIELPSAAPSSSAASSSSSLSTTSSSSITIPSTATVATSGPSERPHEYVRRLISDTYFNATNSNAICSKADLVKILSSLQQRQLALFAFLNDMQYANTSEVLSNTIADHIFQQSKQWRDMIADSKNRDVENYKVAITTLHNYMNAVYNSVSAQLQTQRETHNEYLGQRPNDYTQDMRNWFNNQQIQQYNNIKSFLDDRFQLIEQHYTVTFKELMYRQRFSEEVVDILARHDESMQRLGDTLRMKLDLANDNFILNRDEAMNQQMENNRLNDEARQETYV